MAVFQLFAITFLFLFYFRNLMQNLVYFNKTAAHLHQTPQNQNFSPLLSQNHRPKRIIARNLLNIHLFLYVQVQDASAHV